ncbi:SIMPL domain-containing protein [Brevundimonas sp. FT23028]|uniref:SIMPL domain-containing protein n=1 Tax=Brevundimonas sp. FT23028 TaxID=3393748 RepID=UPI003B588E02
MPVTLDKSLLPAAVFGGLIAAGMVGGGALIGSGVVNAQVGNRQVTVRGLAERNVVADLAVLTLSFKAANDDLPTAQTQIDRDLASVRAFLRAQGYPEDQISVGRMQVTDTRAREYGSSQNTIRYILTQSVTVRTTDVQRVATTERALNDLVRQGVQLDFAAPNYVFTRLNEIRPSMIGEATAAARSGAEQFAKDSGAPLGPIRQATQGSFEILAREDIDPEPTSLNKRVRVVATVTYQLR